MAVNTLERPLTADDVRAREAERRARRLHRTSRVEILGLPACHICGGTTSQVDDPELTCVCVEQKSALAARLARLVADKTGDTVNLGDVIAP